MSDNFIQFDLSVGDHAPMEFDFSQIRALQDRLREFPENICRKESMLAVRRAGKVGRIALEARVRQIGRKTGNLLRAVALKTKYYKKSQLPVAVAVIGYRRSGTGDSKKVPGGQIRIGNDRAFHSHLVEFGTKRRFPGKSRKLARERITANGRTTTKYTRVKEQTNASSVVMSSWNTGGPFGTTKTGTHPRYPFAFIARVDPNKGLGAMPAFHPVKRAFDSSSAIMGRVLHEAMEDAIARATKKLTNKPG